ncbi:hypothetical protein N4R57_16380 [Rhodobacteraceae bacterium D3-12]|nr:hypothetical protein N4R57_16380 [Rhodobacteraceae bacterium D3-12]
MIILNLMGWLAIVAGGLAVWMGLNESEVLWSATGFSAIVTGILFLALDKGLVLLAEIRDALTGLDEAEADDETDGEPYF